MATLLPLSQRWLSITLFAGACALAGAGMPVYAALGGNQTTVTLDRSALGPGNSSVTATASVKQATTTTSTTATTATTAATYTITTITTDVGTTVNEYLSSAGVVFAIAWSGPQIPDLRQLLGDYFSTYAAANAAQAASAPGTGRGPSQMTGDDLVVHSGGRMRGFQGYAYLKSRLPAGFDVDSIR
ncbi:MAG: DUF2844 domain-containing protein [Janthinobacterium lividum]